jgi:dipeptidyl aminopeptidase/acylaminoacyl peptidase
VSRNLRSKSIGALALLFCVVAGNAAETAYRLPPEPIVRAFDAIYVRTLAPFVTVSPGGRWVLLQYSRKPSITEFTRPTVGLAGWVVDIASNRRSTVSSGLGPIDRFVLFDAISGKEVPLAFPAGDLSLVLWSPDGRRFAFMRSAADHTELWVVDTRTLSLRRIDGAPLNASRVVGAFYRSLPCVWFRDGARLICGLVPAKRGNAPSATDAPGPQIQDTADRPTRGASLFTRPEYRLKTAHDEALYDYYMSAQPAIIDANTGAVQPIGSSGIYEQLEPSPDGRFILSERILHPYSAQTMDEFFPRVIEILASDGRAIHTVGRRPLNTAGGRTRGSVPPGVRSAFWRPDAPATVGWYEALDGGDLAVAATHRDRLLLLPAPFTASPVEVFRSAGRMHYPGRAMWGRNGLLIIEEYDWTKQEQRLWRIDTRSRSAKPEPLWQEDEQEAQAGPGSLVTALGSRSGGLWDQEALFHDAMLLQDGPWLYQRGERLTDGGALPHLDRRDLKTGRSDRLFESKAGTYESVISVLDEKAERLVTSIETAATPAEIHLVNRRSKTRIALTRAGQAPSELAGVRKEHIEYMRSDGVRLDGTLYLPQGRKPGQHLATVIQAYPISYRSESAASKRSGDPPNRFGGLGAAWPLALHGYAVLQAAMPVIGREPYDVINEQLSANATAAVDKLVTMGVADRRRIGVAGHSFGGFMVANLLANTDLFAAGVASSGVYNFTLTPFRFQDERRRYWQVPDVYDRMSPFRHADRIRAPLLLIHGERDNSAGGNLIQSTSLYEALYGLGATARLVVLPYEGHNNVARESHLHAIWETLTWFDRYLASPQDVSVSSSRQ